MSMIEQVNVLIEADELQRRIEALAGRINRDYIGKEVHVVCLLKGAAVFACDIFKRLEGKASIDFMSVSSYGSSMSSSGFVRILKDLDEPIMRKHVLLIDDIVDSGNTLYNIKELLKLRNPASIKTCVLLDKPHRRTVDVEVDYRAFEIEDKFVVGYGLDYDQKYRNLPYIGEISFGNER